MNVLKLDAVLGLIAGLLLLAGFSDGLYDALDLPVPKPAVYAQAAGIAILAFSYLLWTRASRELAGITALANAALAALLAVWLLAGKIAAGALGTTIVVLVAVVLAVFAALEARLARR